MRLDFSIFRTVPFAEASLTFTTGQSIAVRRNNRFKARPVEVAYANQTVLLTPVSGESGPFRPEDAEPVRVFRETFFEDTAPISFDFIDTSRHPGRRGDEPKQPFGGIEYRYTPSGAIEQVSPPRRAQGRSELADRVASFIAAAQVDYRRFFSTTEPELFPRILSRITTDERETYSPKDLRSRLTQIKQEEKRIARVGIEGEPWDYRALMKFLDALPPVPGRAQNAARARRDYALAVLDAYTEVLETRAEQRALVADRLFIFEEVLRDFFLAKTVSVDPRRGLRIQTDEDKELRRNATELRRIPSSLSDGCGSRHETARDRDRY